MVNEATPTGKVGEGWETVFPSLSTKHPAERSKFGASHLIDCCCCVGTSNTHLHVCACIFGIGWICTFANNCIPKTPNIFRGTLAHCFVCNKSQVQSLASPLRSSQEQLLGCSLLWNTGPNGPSSQHYIRRPIYTYMSFLFLYPKGSQPGNGVRNLAPYKSCKNNCKGREYSTYFNEQLHPDGVVIVKMVMENSWREDVIGQVFIVVVLRLKAFALIFIKLLGGIIIKKENSWRGKSEVHLQTFQIRTWTDFTHFAMAFS